MPTEQSNQRIAIIGGTGDQGKGLALRWAKAGFDVIIGSRAAERASDAAKEMQELLAKSGAQIYANTVAGIYQTSWDVLSGGLAFGVAVPYVWMEVQGQAQRIRPDGRSDDRHRAERLGE